jgi:hypothetical protein
MYNRCTKSPPKCFGTPWVPSTGSAEKKLNFGAQEVGRASYETDFTESYSVGEIHVPLQEHVENPSRHCLSHWILTTFLRYGEEKTGRNNKYFLTSALIVNKTYCCSKFRKGYSVCYLQS